MTRERALEKASELQERMGASTLHFDEEFIREELSLTETEFEIVSIICTTPISVDDIAAIGKNSRQTVKNHFYNIYRKLEEHTDLGKGKDKRINMINFLVDVGALEYRPKVEI